MAEISVLATYWNEMEWVRASLAQLERIDPVEIIICDGCFDPRHPNRSTDGTREILQSWVRQRPKARLISAVRWPVWWHLLAWLRPLPHERLFSWARVKHLAELWRLDPYRLNQMATFNRMIRLSRCFRPGAWFMTYDCDQFYSDSMLEAFRSLLPDTECNMLTCREYTFFGDFDHYTDQHETRDYNNMPHRAFGDTRFVPTRHPARIVGGRYRIYTEVETKKQVGIVYHYHVKSPQRLAAGYALGDRRPPSETRTRTTRYDGAHPTVVREHFL